MNEFISKKVILWDFDGVIVDSSEIREEGFRETLANYPNEEVEKLVSFHIENGGLSRYVKFRYFFEKVRNEEVSKEKVQELSDDFSVIMKKKLTKNSLLITEVIKFIEQNHKKFIMHIVSGSDEKELKYLCRQLEISNFFNSIHGSPVPKIELVKNLVSANNYKREDVCLIGDSINDYEAARENKIEFFGYNNPALNTPNRNYIYSFNEDS